MENKLRVTFELDVTSHVSGLEDNLVLAAAKQYAFDLIFQSALLEKHEMLIKSQQTYSGNKALDDAVRHSLRKEIEAIKMAENSAKFELISSNDSNE
jgi:hypothetical protein